MTDLSWICLSSYISYNSENDMNFKMSSYESYGNALYLVEGLLL